MGIVCIRKPAAESKGRRVFAHQDPDGSHTSRYPIACGSWTAQQRSTSSNRASPLARVLGTFSHTSRCPIACVLRTWLLDGSAAVNVVQSRFAVGSRSWDVFAYEPLPNRLRPSDLALGRLSSRSSRRAIRGSRFLRASSSRLRCPSCRSARRFRSCRLPAGR